MQNTELQNPAESDLKKTNKPRNYELDFFKLVLAVFVFWTHTSSLNYTGEKATFPPMLGRVAVHFYFILSGMFMANSTVKQKYSENEPGKAAITFVLKKFKSLALNWGTAFVICAAVTLSVNFKSWSNLLKSLAGYIPEMLLVQNKSTDLLNRPVWYIAAMFFCMLPLAYMLYKKHDFALHIFAPIAAVTLYLYMWNTNKTALFYQYDFIGIVTGGVIDAFCGLCFGLCAYGIYTHISKNANRNLRVLFTVTEVLLYGIFFGAWFGLRTNKATMSVLLLLPIVTAITFSGQSYIAGLFRFKWMRFFAPLSLLIFLNQQAARVIVTNLFAGKPYVDSVVLMALFTAAFSLLSFVIVKLLKLLWEKKLKAALTKPDK